MLSNLDVGTNGSRNLNGTDHYSVLLTFEKLTLDFYMSVLELESTTVTSAGTCLPTSTSTLSPSTVTSNNTVLRDAMTGELQHMSTYQLIIIEDVHKQTFFFHPMVVTKHL